MTLLSSKLNGLKVPKSAGSAKKPSQLNSISSPPVLDPKKKYRPRDIAWPARGVPALSGQGDTGRLRPQDESTKARMDFNFQ